MQSIWEYQLEVDDKQIIEIPLHSRILSIQTQFENPYIWVGVPDTEAEKEKVSIRTFGTGNPIVGDISDYTFLGTYQLMSGSLVFHVFFKYP